MNRLSFAIPLILTMIFIASCGKEGDQVPAAGRGDQTTAVRAQPSTLAAPAGVSTLSGDGQITISWNKVEGATSYSLYFSNSPNVSPATGTKTGGITQTSYTHIGLQNNTMYYHIVTAENASGEGLPSGETGAMPNAAPPAAPTGVAAVSGGDRITVRWEPVQRAASYTVYYAEKPGLAKAKGKRVTGIRTTSFRHDDVKKKAMYYYVVTAVNDEGESPASGETGAMP